MNQLTYRWARTGSRPRAVHDQRTQSTYLFGAVCPERGTGSGLVLPVCNAEAMQFHLDDIAAKVAPRAHAILIFDQAGWHGAKALKTPSNVSLMPLPPRSPELNSQENIWQFMRANWLSNRAFKSYDDIVDHCCYAWNTLVDQPWKIMSIARREWATIGCPEEKMQREGLFRELKRLRFYEKPSDRVAREKSEAIRRRRKLAPKQAVRDGLIAAPPKKRTKEASTSSPRGSRLSARAGLDKHGHICASTSSASKRRIATIECHDALILPHCANPAGWNLQEPHGAGAYFFKDLVMVAVNRSQCD